MGQVEIRCLRVGMIQTNCYLVYDSEIKEAIITDPGDDAGYIEECVDKLGLEVKAVFLTHGHSDHFKGLQEIKNKYKVPVYIHKDDAYRLKYQGGFVEAAYELEADDVLVDDKDHFSIGGMEIDCIHTPGHTEGGLCYYFPENGILLAGDTLFRHSWGRTDFPGGNSIQLMASIREKLLKLPEETLVLPGHEDTTTIKEERIVHRFSC